MNHHEIIKLVAEDLSSLLDLDLASEDLSFFLISHMFACAILHLQVCYVIEPADP